MNLVDVYNMSENTVWMDGRPLRGGGRWLGRDPDLLPPELDGVPGVVIVDAGAMPVPVRASALEAAPQDLEFTEEEDVIVLLSDVDELFPPEEPAPTVVEVPGTHFDDALIHYGLYDYMNLTVLSIAGKFTKKELYEVAEDLGVTYSSKMSKLVISDRIYERILDVKVRGSA